MLCPAGDLLWKQKGAVEGSRAELANKNPVYPNVSVRAASFVSELQTCRTARPDCEMGQTVKIWTLKSYIYHKEDLVPDLTPLSQRGKRGWGRGEMQLETKSFAKRVRAIHRFLKVSKPPLHGSLPLRGSGDL